MKEVTSEQVKEHFKYAKEVRCAYDEELMDISEIKETINYFADGFWLDTPVKGDSNCMLYNELTNQFAPIISYIFERGEEVEVSSAGEIWHNFYFIGFNKNRLAVVENIKGEILTFFYIRKLSPETQLQPQIDALTEEAKRLGIEITFKILK
jgi:hypothetical protein